MRKDLFKTLFARMLTTYLTVIMLLLLLMGITVSSMFRNQYMQEEEESLRKETAKINAILVEKYIDPDKRQTAVDEINTAARLYGALIQVVDSMGGIASFYDFEQTEEKWGPLTEAVKKTSAEEELIRVSLPGLDVYPTAQSVQRTGARQKLLSFERRDIQAVPDGGTVLYDLFLGFFDLPTLTFARVVDNGGRPDGIILMHLDMSNVNASISRVYMDVLLIGLLAVVVAVLAVYYLTTRITKPITDMNSIVRRYSKGSFELRLDDQGADEVAQLARSFNVMANELASLEHARKSFVANVSHELRSPLTSISGFLEAIQDGTIPPEKQHAYIALVIAETRRMTGMVNDLLDLARIESGQNPLKLTQFDINELARRTILTFEARITSKKLDVELRLVEPGCYVEADMDQIAQVLRNLIDNAIKFSREGGRLIIETDIAARRTARVCVRDFGAGIPAEDLPHVFTRFFKAEKAHTPSAQSGTGLGLSIARVIIDRHGQEISVESGEDSGTAFTFTLKHITDMRRRAAEQG